MARSSASSRKNSGNSPNNSVMNTWADIGTPSGRQKLVAIIC